jgi:hypothetical protein
MTIHSDRKVIELYSFKDITKLGNTMLFSLETENSNFGLFQVNYNDDKNDEIKIELKITKASDKLNHNISETIEGKILKHNGIQRIKLYSNRHAVGEMLVDSNYHLIDDDDDVSEAPLTPLTPMPTLQISSIRKVTPIPTSSEIHIVREHNKRVKPLWIILLITMIMAIATMTGETANKKTALQLQFTTTTVMYIVDDDNDKFHWVSRLWFGYPEFSKDGHQWQFKANKNNTFKIMHKEKCLSKMLKLSSCDKSTDWLFSKNFLCVNDNLCLSKVDKKIVMNEEKSKRILISLVNNDKKYSSINVKY